MCGIVGYMTNETKAFANTRYRFLHQAIIADTMRGDDSTGAYFVEHDIKEGQSPAYCKSTAAGYDFVTYDKNWHEMSGDGSEYFAAIGHNRSATVGSISPDTAHPFRHGPITLVHNGTLRGTHTLPTPQSTGGYFNDSDTIAGNLVDTPIWDLAPNLNGAYTLVWHDARDRTMNILRNDERPLYIAKAKGQETLFMASESMMLQWLLSRLKVGIEMIAYPKPHQWLRFEHGNLRPEITEVGHYTPQVYSAGNYGYAASGWEGYWDDRADPVGARPKAPAPKKAGPSDHLVSLGGRKREVPAAAQDALLELDLLVEDREIFRPYGSASGTEDRVRMVKGELPETGMTAMIYGVPKAIAEGEAAGRDWVVQPVAVKWHDVNEPVVVCKLKHTDAGSPSGRSLLTSTTSDDDSYEVVEPDDEPQIYGPSGRPVDLSWYLEKTGNGCAMCSGNIYVGDAEELMWVNDGQDALCAPCSRDIQETINEG